MKRILIAPNSFKECSYSFETAELIHSELSSLLNTEKPGEYELVTFPVSDGGDGFNGVVKKHFNTRELSIKISSMYGRGYMYCPVEYSAERKTVFIESAKAVGLNLVPVESRNPLILNSRPIGELLLELERLRLNGSIDFNEVMIGIGGTAINDLGIGMMNLLGMKLYDSGGIEIEPLPVNFLKADKIKFPGFNYNFSVKVVTDVSNKLLGDKGAANIFAMQKGAREEDIPILEEGFKKIISLLDISDDNLSGAGGGLAAAFQIFFNGEIVSSERFILEYLGLDSKNSNFHLIITGEGLLDNQTLLNKGANVVAGFFKNDKENLYFICGEDLLKDNEKFPNIIELKNFFKNREESIKNFKLGIKFACKSIIEKWNNK